MFDKMIRARHAGHANPGPASERPRVSMILAATLALAGTGTGCSLDGEATTAGGVTVRDNGGIVLEPNTIRGRVRITNQNPEILAIIDSDPRRYVDVVATSKSPNAGYSASTPRFTPDSLRDYTFDMSVEAAAGGPDGIEYDLSASWFFHSSTSGYKAHTFQPVRTRVQPRSVQPAPTEVEIAECLGVLRFQWGHDDACTEPVAASRSDFGQTYWLTGGTEHHHYVRGGTSGTSTLTYHIGDDAYDDRLVHRRSVDWSVDCDQVVTICTRIPDAAELGAAQGPWQVVGEESTRTRRVLADGGPDGNYRYAIAPLDASPSEPDTWWTLPNMVPGDYTLFGYGWLRRGREHTLYYPPGIRPLSIAAGQTSNAPLLVDGQERHAFVMHPAYMQGSIRLADPYVVSQPGAESSLDALFFEADIDSNQDGLPDYDWFNSRIATYLRATANSYDGFSSVRRGYSYTSFPGRFDPATGALASSYEQVLPNLYDLAASWRQNWLRLGFWSVGTYQFITRPGDYDPVRFRHGYLHLAQRQNTSALLGPGQTHRVDHEYCFNEVQLQYSTTGEPFYNPSATISGSFQGTDWRGQEADYTASGRFTGIPAALGIPQSEAVTYAENRGAVSFALPQGTYTLTPGATLVHPDGSTNDATFQPIDFTLGCGQRLKLVPPLTVTVDAQPACAQGPATTVSGTVKSAPATVDRIWYRMNGGPEITLCTNCGLDPDFSFPVTLATCENAIEVFAYSAGMPEPATGSVQMVWDDPADGPSCADSTCVNKPPVALCQNAVVAADDTCTGCGSVDAGSYDPEGAGITCVESTSCPYAPGRHRVTLTCTDAHGATASCAGTVTVEDRTPPSLTCPADLVFECPVDGQVDVIPAPAQASDACSAVSVIGPAPGSYPVGTHEVTYVATDEAGNQASCTSRIVVADLAPPDVDVDHAVDLWPPNHRMHEVSLADCGVTVTDVCSQDPAAAVASLAITCVSSDEPAGGPGPGPGSDDIEWVDDTRVRVRAERNGQGDGRVYRIHFLAGDAAGNQTPGVCEVRVAHDQGGAPAAHSGEAYSVCR